MKTSILIFTFCLVLHFVTPHWFYSDFLNIADWILLGCAAIGLVFYKNARNTRLGMVAYLALGYNTLIYFLTTIRVSPQDAGNEAVFSRIGAIFSIHFNTVRVGKVVETFNFVQVGVGLILIASLAIISFTKRFAK